MYLREKFQGDLTLKIQKGLTSEDFGNTICNCQKTVKDENGVCAYKGMCNQSVIIYQVTCRNSGKIYIGSTQQKFKERMEQHFDDVRLWFRKGQRTDTFARHFSRYFSKKPTAGEIRSLCDFKSLLTQRFPYGICWFFGNLIENGNLILFGGWICRRPEIWQIKRQSFLIVKC